MATLALWFIDTDAETAAVSAGSSEELPWPSDGFRGTSEGEKERRTRGIWGN
jgi:hypothetical protein